MKKIVILILMALVVNAVALAQTYQEVVYLKNGSVIRGVIIEQIPNVSLRVQTSDGSIFAYQMDEVEKITKEQITKKVSAKKERNSTPNPYALKTGYRGFFEGGYNLVGGGNGFEFTTTHGYQVLPWFFTGIGVGVDWVKTSVGNSILPAYYNFRLTLPRRSVCQPFFDFKLGYSVLLSSEYKFWSSGMHSLSGEEFNGIYMSPSIGCRFAVGKNCGLNLGVGYVLEGKENMDGFAIRLGFDF